MSRMQKDQIILNGRPKPKKDEDEKKDKDDESRQSKSFVESSHGESSKKSIWPSSMSLAIPMEYEDLGIDPDDPEPLGQSSSEEDQVNIAASSKETELDTDLAVHSTSNTTQPKTAARPKIVSRFTHTATIRPSKKERKFNSNWLNDPQFKNWLQKKSKKEPDKTWHIVVSVMQSWGRIKQRLCVMESPSST
ncbi:hypothetical protein J6590_018345 [Homalodisca vitripennis]|nr:hypothetical protein J6590_018345 [Homalodisca vitripennis]